MWLMALYLISSHLLWSMVTDNPIMSCPTALASALQAVAAGLSDASNHHFLKANYYALVKEDEARCWLAAMWVNAETTHSLELGTDELQLDVLLDGRYHWTRVRTP
jgi:hypothetical protein